MLASIDFQNPLLWAVMVAWILSVVLHEFAHGLVGYWGGDYTIRERGGLTLNPIQYIDPMFSIALPCLFLLMGGVPLPGGVTYIRRDLLRSRAWDSAVSFAGPSTNLLLFFACALPLHPHFGWLDTANPTSTQLLLGAMAVLQMIAVVLNLIPVPPLDGFGVIGPWLPPDLERKLTTPPWSTGLMVGFFALIWMSNFVTIVFVHLVVPILAVLGFDESGREFFGQAFADALFSK